MDSYEYNERLNRLKAKIKNIKSIIDPDGVEKRLGEIQKIEQESDFWGDAKRAAKIQQEKNKVMVVLLIKGCSEETGQGVKRHVFEHFFWQSEWHLRRYQSPKP